MPTSYDKITMKDYFNDYLIPKLKDIIKILLFNRNKIFGKISLDLIDMDKNNLIVS